MQLRKNLFTTKGYTRQNSENIVFISYRREYPDIDIARECAERLERIDGVHYWLDEKDKCMQQARDIGDEVRKGVQQALCIEQGLDSASALLGIIGPNTFNSPWIPYEIGGARGRQQFRNGFSFPPGFPSNLPPNFPTLPHPLLAHRIEDIDLSEVPAFVALGNLLTSSDEVEDWAQSVVKLGFLVHSSPSDVEDIQREYKLDKIYVRNTEPLRRRLAMA